MIACPGEGGVSFNEPSNQLQLLPPSDFHRSSGFFLSHLLQTPHPLSFHPLCSVSFLTTFFACAALSQAGPVCPCWCVLDSSCSPAAGRSFCSRSGCLCLFACSLSVCFSVCSSALGRGLQREREREGKDYFIITLSLSSSLVSFFSGSSLLSWCSPYQSRAALSAAAAVAAGDMSNQKFDG